MDSFDIDAVVTWVDGNDPRWRRLKNSYLSGTSDSQFDDIAGDTRYASVGEIKYCIASLLRFAPFLRKIFIVTPAQNPELDGFINIFFPDRVTQIEIIDQDILFSENNECLPVFNSLSVESMIWKIPDLSSHFIYLNDDFLLLRPIYPSDFFTEDGRPIAYAEQLSSAKVKLWRKIKPSFKGHKKFGLKDAMVNAADALGGRKSFIYFGHTPNALLRSVYEQFDAQNPGVLAQNANHRFRDPSQFHPQELGCLLARDAGLLEIRPYKGQYLYLKPKKSKSDTEYISKTLEYFDSCTDARFCCFNSLDRASEKGRTLVLNWMNRRLGIQ